MDFFERFTALCKEEGGTTTGVGQSLGYSKATVGRWRYGSIPSADALTACLSKGWLLSITCIFASLTAKK